MTLHEELQKAAHTVEPTLQPTGKSRHDYLYELTEAIGQKIDAKVWDGLSDPAQQWYNSAAQLLNTDKEAPFLEGFDKEGEHEQPAIEVVAPKVVEQPKVVVKGTPSGRADSSKPNPANTPKPTPVVAKVEKMSTSRATRIIIVKNMELTVAQVKDELGKMGIAVGELKDSSIITIRTDTINTLNVALEMGWKKP